NLYWTSRDAGFAKDDPRWAEASFEVLMPDESQAKKVVERMLGAKEKLERYWTWDTPDFADFACLRYSVYLPVLEKMAADTPGGRNALLGIAHNPTPEATEALFRLLKTADNKSLTRVVAALCDRLPEPKGFARPDRHHPIQIEIDEDSTERERDADPKLVKPG